MSNVITFPGRNPAPGAALRNSSFDYARTSPLPPANVAQLEVQASGQRRRYASMLTYAFRSYDSIMASSEAELARDVRCDTNKAATKLFKIRRQIQRDRELAAAREALLTVVEARLAAALRTVTGPLVER